MIATMKEGEWFFFFTQSKHNSLPVEILYKSG